MGYTNPFLSTTLLLLLLFSILRPSLVAAVSVNAVVAPVYLDKAKYLYTVSLGSGQSYLLDIGGYSVWSVCPKSHITFPCKSYQCSLASASTNSSSYVSCHRHTCTTQSQNPMTGKRARSELTYTRAMLKATDGLKPGAPITFPKVLSSCAPHNLLKGLPANSVGSMGLGPSNLALQSQLAGLTKRFAFCVPLNDTKPGMIFFGNGPYNILSPGLVEATQYQTTAPMVRDPTRPDDYFLPVKEMEISGYDVGKVSTTTVKGRTKISTLVPYTTLSTPLYRALVKAFDNVTRHIPRAPLVAPFQRCLDISAFPRGKYGPPSLWDFLYIGPTFFLKMKGGDDWEFLNAENMKQVSKDVLCLAYLDGGVHPQDDIVIGLYQMKERLVLFDLEANTIGISSTNINYIHGYCGDFLARV